MAPGGFERVAHRGSPRERVENTLPGFILALEHGADAIELDVHATADGVIVVHHDDVVQDRRIAESSWPDLSILDLGGGARIPALQDVLVAVGDRASMYIELKGRAVEAATVAVARQHGGRYAVHSFDHDAIARVAEAAPDVARGVLIERGVDNPVGMMRTVVQRVHPRDVWPHWSLVDARFMDAAAQLGVRVIPWTVNSRQAASRLAEWGVAGVCTDDVRLLVNL